MKRLTQTLPLILLSLLLSACANTPLQTSDNINHIVMVWYKDSVTTKQQETIKKETRKLKDIPGIVSLDLGNAIPSKRPIVDDSFDLGIVMTFKNEADMNAYLKHSQHQAFVKEHIKGKVEKLLVYDF